MYRCVASSWQAMTSRDTSLIAAPAGAVAVNNIARAIKRAATEGIQVESLDYAIPAELDHCCFKKSVIRVETGQFLSFPLNGMALKAQTVLQVPAKWVVGQFEMKEVAN